ncbi:hypothetical protein ACFFH4_09035 [Halalkalibacter alkalisediminis]|uniref:Uncharacterized protein n=2 Tax=Halalkalibacter alkalisediminis TaxID=935616 RepID=A0ABV6NGD1_9BACI
MFLKLNLYDEKNNEEIQVAQLFADDQTEVKYWVQPPTSIKTEEDIRNVVKRVMEMMGD